MPAGGPWSNTAGQDEEYTSGWAGKSGGDDHEEKTPLSGLFGKDGRLPSPREPSSVSTSQEKQSLGGQRRRWNDLVMSDLRKCDPLVYRREISRKRAAW